MTAQPTPESIHDAVKQRYRQVAASAADKFKYPTGREGAEALGYASADLDAAPRAMLATFCGVGNPLALGELQAGQTVLDVGCGAGLDLWIASRRVAPGQVFGIDLTLEMVSAAHRHLTSATTSENQNSTAPAGRHVMQAGVEQLPFPDASFDVVISNGVLNLSPHKVKACKEIHRVMRPGGSLQFADIVLDGALPAEVAGSLAAWSD